MPTECPRLPIRLAGPTPLRASVVNAPNLVLQCESIMVEADGYIPDVRIRFRDDVSELRLYDNGLFIDEVMQVLRDLGYAGKPFDRAELGMQGPHEVVLEPGPEFKAWISKRGWRDLATADD